MNPSDKGSASAHQARPRGDPGVSVSAARVIVTPVSHPLVHPLSKRDVQRVLSVLPAESVEGLRSVSLLGDQLTAAGAPVLASYRREGFIRLHAVSTLPWRLERISSALAAELARFGAGVENLGGVTTVRWTPESLRLFFTVGALLPGVARHHREQQGEPEASSVVRALDAGAEPWQVSDIALAQWRRFLASESR